MPSSPTPKTPKERRQHWVRVFLLVAVMGPWSLDARSLEVPPELQATQRKYRKVKTLSALFEQTVKSAMTQNTKVSAGRIWIQLPDKIRWETSRPDPSILVSNGKVFWFYTPPFDPSDAPEVVTRKASQVQSRLAYALLAGNFDAAPLEAIRKGSGAREFLLTPKAGSAGTVQEARIEVEPTGIINKVYLKHGDGNEVTILLSEIRFGERLGPKFFAFKP